MTITVQKTPAPTTPKRLLTREEAAAYCGLKLPSLDNLLCKGRGPARIKLGRLVRFKIEDLDAWIEAGRIEGPMPTTKGE